MQIRPALTIALAACFLLRAFMPLGYMPGNLLAGEFARLCPSVMPIGTHADGHHAHHGNDSGEPAASAAQTCEFSVAASQSFVPQPGPADLASADTQIRAPEGHGIPVGTRQRAAFRPRGPPTRFV